MIIEGLIGKTIVRAERRKLKKSDSEYLDSYSEAEIEEWDDVPILELEMNDGSIFIVKSTFGGYTGQSRDEYPAFISIKDVNVLDRETEDKDE